VIHIPIDVDCTKMSADEIRVLNELTQLIGRMDKQLRGMNEIMPDTEFITRCDTVIDMINELNRDFKREVRGWRNDVRRQ